MEIIDYEVTCAAGLGLAQLRHSLAQQTTGLRPNNLKTSHLKTWVGMVEGVREFEWSADLASWESWNNALIALALGQGTFKQAVARAKTQFDPKRIGVVMGSSTSSIDRTETAYQHLIDDQHLASDFQQEFVLNPHAPGLFVAHCLGLSGPTITINTACSSSAKVFATASRWIECGLVDAVVVGGADTLCLSVLHGFHSLQLVSENQCRPFDSERDGINLGEGAGFALLAKPGTVEQTRGVYLRGFGESSDAHHMSHPHPEGAGARLAIDAALTLANIQPNDIGYINLHGTASRANDNIEGNLVGAMFPNTIASSTKAWMGHTLGAAGIVEGLIALDALHTNLLPGTLNLSTIDPEIAINMTADNQHAQSDFVMSNSFGFGGNNACLIFGREPA